MKTIQEYLVASKVLNEEIERSFRKLGYKDEESFQDIDIDSFTPDEMLTYNELRKAFDKLEDFNYLVQYLETPVKKEGIIRENENGRFELENYYEFTSGSRIEALIYDDFYDKDIWVRTSVESNTNGYYLVGYRNVSMEGLKVRIR